MRINIITLIFLLIVTLNANAEPIQLATGEWAPYTSESFENYGFITEIISQVLKSMNVEPSYHFYPWRRCYKKTVTGEIWATFPYAYTKDRAEEVFFSDPIFDSKTKLFFYKKNADYRYETLDDLKQYRIGGVLGYFYENDFKKSGIEATYYHTELDALKNLQLGVIDLLPLNMLVAENLIKKNYPDVIHHFGTLEKSFAIDNLHLIVSKKHKNAHLWIEKFNAELARFKQTNQYRMLLQEYALTNDTPSPSILHLVKPVHNKQ